MNKGLPIVLLIAAVTFGALGWMLATSPYLFSIELLAGMVAAPLAIMTVPSLLINEMRRLVNEGQQTINRNAQAAEISRNAYVKCPSCGSEELIKMENGRVMIPYEDADYAMLSGTDYFTCAKCGMVIGDVVISQTLPVAGRDYIPCEACGSTEFLLNTATRVKVRNGDRGVEDIGKTISTLVCTKCGHPFDEPVESKPAGGQVQTAASD